MCVNFDFFYNLIIGNWNLACTIKYDSSLAANGIQASRQDAIWEGINEESIREFISFQGNIPHH